MQTIKTVVRCMAILILLSTDLLVMEYNVYPLIGRIARLIGIWLMYIPIYNYYSDEEHRSKEYSKK